MIWNLYRGIMAKISESTIPFPHRKGNLFKIQYVTSWYQGNKEAITKHMDWINEVYDYIGAYVPTSPRVTYVKYRDLDLGINDKSNTSFNQASV
ncbi:hypothetical protein DITRI_Ditri19aG0203000 [Diplodiscus trichospermus]